MAAAAAAAADVGIGLFNTIFNGVQAKKTRDEYWHYSRRAHQDEVLDLEKAGINPLMTAGGAGAPAQMGPTAQSNIPGRALEAYQIKNRLEIDRSLAGAQLGLIRANQASAEATARKTNAEEEQIRLNVLNNPTLIEQIKASTRAGKARAEIDELDAKKKRAFSPAWDAVGEGVNTLLQSYPGLIDWLARKIVDWQRSGRNPDTGLWDGTILGFPALVDPGKPKPGTIKFRRRPQPPQP